MQDYSKVAARWWVEKILEVAPAEALWGKFDVSKALTVSQFIANVSDYNQKEIFVDGLAKKIERYLKKHGRLEIAYPGGIIYPDDEFYCEDGDIVMKVPENKVEVWPGDGPSRIIYHKDKPQ